MRLHLGCAAFELQRQAHHQALKPRHVRSGLFCRVGIVLWLQYHPQHRLGDTAALACPLAVVDGASGEQQ